jgi:hypothetical protein
MKYSWMAGTGPAKGGAREAESVQSMLDIVKKLLRFCLVHASRDFDTV